MLIAIDYLFSQVYDIPVISICIYIYSNVYKLLLMEIGFSFFKNSSYEPSCVCLLMYRCKNFLGFMPRREITGL